MKLESIKSVRRFQTYASWDIVYEWEDVLQKEMKLPFSYVTRWNSFYLQQIRKLIGQNFFWESLFSKQTSLAFEMIAKKKHHFYNRPTIIPWIIDFHLEDQEIENFRKSYRHVPLLLVSNLEAVEYLKEKSFPKDVFHLPLSISDKYKIHSTTKFEKLYDVVSAGRMNPVLESFMNRYSEEHPDFVYVFRKRENNRFNYYTSKGDCLGDFSTRNEYMKLLTLSKVGLYSTPGIDGGETRTKGFNQVTPRFLELVSSGCHVIARYKENADTNFYGLSNFSPNVETYEEFEKIMDRARKEEVDMEMYAKYLENHYTSVRVKALNRILAQYNK